MLERTITRSYRRLAAGVPLSKIVSVKYPFRVRQVNVQDRRMRHSPAPIGCMNERGKPEGKSKR